MISKELIDFKTYLKKLMAEKGYSYRQLAMLADIDHTYISKIISGKMGTPSPEILKKISKPLGISYELLLIKAGYIENSSVFAFIELTQCFKEVALKGDKHDKDPNKLNFLVRLTADLLNQIIKNNQQEISTEDIRFVATLFKGAVDMWYPKK